MTIELILGDEAVLLALVTDGVDAPLPLRGWLRDLLSAAGLVDIDYHEIGGLTPVTQKVEVS